MSATLGSIFLLCRDLEASVDFYLRLGFQARKQTERTAVFELGNGNGPELHLHAELTETEQAQYQVRYQPGSTGMVLSMKTENLDAILTLAPEGSLLVAPRHSAWGTRLAILCDPDGYRLEFQSGVPQ